MKVNPLERIGLKFTLLNGEKIEIIDYLNSRSCTVKFLSDNTIRYNANWGNIVRGKLDKINFKDKNRLSERLNFEYLQNCGDVLKILEYKNPNNCTVKFLSDNSIKTNVRIQNIENGNVLNDNFCYKKVVYNIGYFGKGIYTARYKTYQIWRNMFQRCYDENWKLNNKTYKDCIIDERWHCYQDFSKWYDENSIKNFDLDKDILFKGNKIYGPDTCCFVPDEINSLLVANDINRGDYPIGVSVYLGKNVTKYISQLSINNKHIQLGRFDTVEEAFLKYKEEKEKQIKLLADKYINEITNKTYLALYNYKIEITD